MLKRCVCLCNGRLICNTFAGGNGTFSDKNKSVSLKAEKKMICMKSNKREIKRVEACA